MNDDFGFDIDFNDPGAVDAFYGVPSDHPAFRGPDEDADDDGLGPANSTVPGVGHPHGGNVLQLPVGRYDGFGNQDNGGMGEVVGTDDARQRAADRAALERNLDRARADVASRAIGQRNAIAHSRSVSDGEGDSGAGDSQLRQQLAASLEAAGIQFKERGSEPSGDISAVDVVETFLNHSPEAKANGGFRVAGQQTVPLTRAKRGITEIPRFTEAHLEGMMGGLKSNVAGTWVLTLHINPESYHEVTKMAMAHGLALDIFVKKKSRNE